MTRRRNRRVKRSLFALKSYLIFFLLVAFVVTCSFLLFLNGLELSAEMIRRNAVLTFGNILFLSLLFSIIDGLRRKYTIERPVNRILAATRRLTEGDFSVRIPPLHRAESKNEFDVISEDFNKMAAELSSIETLRTDFIASVSHELKTPLAVIQNYAALLQTPGLTAEAKEQYTKAILEATRKFSKLISNILKLNKLENQQIFPQRQRYDLGEQLRGCLLHFEDAWEQKQLLLDVQIADAVEVQADAELLTLVWNNLFSNAVKFTASGGQIRVSLTEDNDYAVVEVADTGRGMTAEVGAHIFEKFYQGDPSHATQGNGLGLALVKRVVDILGGEISVQSNAGQGSVFTVKLLKEAI